MLARLGLAALLLSIAACGSTQQATKDDLPPLRVGSDTWAGSGPIYIAAERSLFSQMGVDVEVVHYTNYNQSMTDLVSRELDGAHTVFSDGIAQAAAGIPVQLVWVLNSSNGADVLVGNSAIGDLEALKGKRVGMTLGSFSQLFVMSELRERGFQDSDITLVNVIAENVPRAIAAGEIDAGHTWDPYLSEVIAAGGTALFTSADAPGVIVDTLFFQNSVLEERPQDIQAFLQAFTNAQKWWAENPDEGNQIVAKAMGITVEELIAIQAGLHTFSLEDNRQAFDPNNTSELSVYQSGQLAIDLFLDFDVIEEAPTLDDIINPSFVQAVTQ
ncbi:MAG: ABC transporter substrate-binding protein [Anaerolineae bacterium]|nr:ABC transporter substrate-binding protein [Anaerolineae bacterium]